MESLYRKYRPLTFDSVVGQRHIVSTLEHAVAEGRLSHAYLLCGPRGTGKTTMARILAKALLCEHAGAARAQGASGCMPDGTCPECRAIAEGSHPDVYELDAASRTGVDNVREEIVNSVSFAPVRGAYKVYIIDEVHMLTTAAFNALLKTLEEPPAHVVFILCTTDPQKIPETILSRCQRFDFHRISNEDLVARMRYICGQEGFGYDEEALGIVAKHARGGMRDALSTLEQLSVFGDGAVRAADARALLGEVATTVLSEFSARIAARDTPALFSLVREQVDSGNDLLELTRDLVGHMRDVYTASIAGAKPELIDGTPEELAKAGEEAALYGDPDRLARTLTVLDGAALEMRGASDPRLVLEIALTRLARPEADLTLESLAERIARLEARLAAGVPSGPMGAAAAAAAGRLAAVSAVNKPAAATPSPASGAVPEPQRGPRPAQAAPRAPQPAPAQPAAAPRPARRPKPAPAPQTAKPAPAAAVRVAAAGAAETPAVTDPGELQRKWAEVARRVMAAQPSRGALLQSSRAVGDDGSTLTVGFPAGSTFAMTMINRPDSHELVAPIVCAVFGKRSVHYTMGEAAPRRAAAPAPKPAPAPQPAPAPKPAPAPQPAAASVPAHAAAAQPAADRDALAQFKLPPPQPPAPQAPRVDQASGPTIVPEPDVDAQRRAWEDEQVPYDDATIAAYEDDEEAPPFDVPGQPAVPAPAPAPSRPEAAPRPAPAQSPQPAAPNPFTHPGLAGDEPKTEEEAKAMLGDIFGAGIVFKDADEPEGR